MSARKAAIITGGATGVGAATGELVLLDSGLHLGSAMRAAVVPSVPPRS